jgi:hypothetical protein
VQQPDDVHREGQVFPVNRFFQRAENRQLRTVFEKHAAEGASESLMDLSVPMHNTIKGLSGRSTKRPSGIPCRAHPYFPLSAAQLFPYAKDTSAAPRIL